MTFQLYALRFEFTARDTVHLPAGQPENTLRGALGTIFRRLACVPECEDPRTCERGAVCPYARIFAPSAIAPTPSGLSDWPRPFVFRAGHLADVTRHPGESFHFDLNIFEMKEPAIRYFVLAFAELAHEGLGPRRGRAHLDAVHRLDEVGHPAGTIYDGDPDRLAGSPAPLLFRLSPPAETISRLRVRFLTPTELKAGGQRIRHPVFGPLFSRARDRIGTLRALYQGGPLPIDFKALGRRAAAVEMTRCEVEWRDATRRSSRTGRSHPLGGFVGEAEYSGDLTEFYPFLKLSEWTGVGRQTVWGKGAVQVSIL